MKKSLGILFLVATCQLIYAGSMENHLRENWIHKLNQRFMSSQFREIIDNFRNIMKTGNTEVGVPILEPLNVTHRKVNIDNKLAKVIGEVSELWVENLSNYTVDKAEFSLWGMVVDLELSWTKINGSTLYAVDGVIADSLPIRGMGNLSFEVTDFSYKTRAIISYGIFSGKISVDKFEFIDISLGNLEVKITGLYDNKGISKLLSSMISNCAVQLVDDYHEKITAVIDKILLVRINNFLKDYTLTELYRIFSKKTLQRLTKWLSYPSALKNESYFANFFPRSLDDESK